jgi:hypothetical protein
MRASVLTVRGQYEAARADCERLQGLAPDLNVVACMAGIDALTGKARPAAAALERSLTAMPNPPSDARAWIASLLGEIAQRQDDPAAEKHFLAALAADQRDLYTLAAYCDWLLDHGRPQAVIPLTEKQPRVDALLLRLALAQKALRLADANASIAMLRARFDASHARGDSVHRREEARFRLHLTDDPKLALRLAWENWDVQREPPDVRILAEAASAAGDVDALGAVRQWLAQTGLEYRSVEALAKQTMEARR